MSPSLGALKGPRGSSPRPPRAQRQQHPALPRFSAPALQVPQDQQAQLLFGGACQGCQRPGQPPAALDAPLMQLPGRSWVTSRNGTLTPYTAPRTSTSSADSPWGVLDTTSHLLVFLSSDKAALSPLAISLGTWLQNPSPASLLSLSPSPTNCGPRCDHILCVWPALPGE